MFLWGAVVIFLGVSVLVSFLNPSSGRSNNLKAILPKENEVVHFTEQGTTEVYTYTKQGLSPKDKVVVENATIIESVPSPDGHIVLADVSGTEGTVLGMIDGDNNFIPLLSDGTKKTDLAVLPGNTAVFTVVSLPVVFLNPESLPVFSVEETVEEVSDEETSTNEVSPSQGSGIIFAFDIQNGEEAYSLGKGKSPRFIGGRLVALSPEGIVSINPVTKKHTVLLPYFGADSLGSNISPDGTVAVLKAFSNTYIDMYDLTIPIPAYLGTAKLTAPVYGTAFINNEYMLLRTKEHKTELYTIPTYEIPVSQRIAFIPISINQ